MVRLALIVTALITAASPTVAQTVILVRHAEKADASADPALSAAGEARARLLANALAGASLDSILVTPLRRTEFTAGPVATASGLTPVAVPLEGSTEAHVARVVEQVRRAGPDETLLVVGHSNTVPAIARALGGSGVADMADCEYDRLTILSLSDATTVIETRYGAASDCAPPG